MEGTTNTNFSIIPKQGFNKGPGLPKTSINEQKKRLDNIPLDYDPGSSKEPITIIMESQKNTDTER